MIKFNLVTSTFVLFVVFSVVLYISATHKQQNVIKYNTLSIEKQVALDLPLLRVSNQFFKHSGDTKIINRYIDDLNRSMNNDTLSLRHIAAENTFDMTLQPNQFMRKLRTNAGYVVLVFDKKTAYFNFYSVLLHVIFLLCSVAMSVWLKILLIKNIDKNAQNGKEQTLIHMPFTLIIDLKSKTLFTSYLPDEKIALANKPLCFYLALIEFCKINSDVNLNQNKDVPDELVELANKYFQRLIALGHTIRKQPNFNSSLEKTLSEIRAALDNVLRHYPQQKQLFYPPKAFGQGSRSRLHSYALVNIAKAHIEIKGK